MPRTATCKIERLRVVAGQPHRDQSFFIRPGSRHRPWRFFQGWEVPEFEGDHAWFEVERQGRCWVFHRQVPGPGGAP